jgi:hypothetical protein
MQVPKYWVALAVGIVAIVAGPADRFLPKASSTAAQNLPEGESLTFELGDNQLHIPRNYFLRAPLRERAPDGIFIAALMPSMSPMRNDNKDEFLHPDPPGHGKTINILMEDARKRTTIAFRLNVEKESGARYVRKPDMFGLQVLLPEDTTMPVHGGRQELYIAGEGDEARSFIDCYRDGSMPYPACSETFTYRNLLVGSDYGKGYLPKWRNIEQDVKDLIDRFSPRT